MKRLHTMSCDTKSSLELWLDELTIQPNHPTDLLTAKVCLFNYEIER